MEPIRTGRCTLSKTNWASFNTKINHCITTHGAIPTSLVHIPTIDASSETVFQNTNIEHQFMPPYLESLGFFVIGLGGHEMEADQTDHHTEFPHPLWSNC
ncbi:hypothetical protein AVEN_45483-1 [Araneus ventricosus]|uniref:Uncharacterized protein n=1 Tax=Araneus ventricosus TaxID=182803 RepID=A0A4Y2MBZ4_ARAVE|nr:hypothetical protein AVEN_45483-1 [Araneus ventricosus]